MCGGVCSLCNSNNRPLGMQGKCTPRKQQSLLFHCRYGRHMRKKWKDVFSGARALWAVTRVGKKAHREVKAWGTFSWQSSLVLISFSLASEEHVEWPLQNAQLLRSPLSPSQWAGHCRTISASSCHWHTQPKWTHPSGEGRDCWHLQGSRVISDLPTREKWEKEWSFGTLEI